jgi:Peptidase M16 inactive domain
VSPLNITMNIQYTTKYVLCKQYTPHALAVCCYLKPHVIDTLMMQYSTSHVSLMMCMRVHAFVVYCSLEALTPSMLHAFREQHFTTSNMVLVGAGVQHDELLQLGDKYFSGLPYSIPGTEPNSPTSQV